MQHSRFGVQSIEVRFSNSLTPRSHLKATQATVHLAKTRQPTPFCWWLVRCEIRTKALGHQIAGFATGWFCLERMKYAALAFALLTIVTAVPVPTSNFTNATAFSTSCDEGDNCYDLRMQNVPGCTSGWSLHGLWPQVKHVPVKATPVKTIASQWSLPAVCGAAALAAALRPEALPSWWC